MSRARRSAAALGCREAVRGNCGRAGGAREAAIGAKPNLDGAGADSELRAGATRKLGREDRVHSF